MKRVMKSFATLALMITLQIIVYSFFLKPFILSWGANDTEVKMELAGDNLAPYISATRAIAINAPASTVWNWIIQLGADRGGFFSYRFIEKTLGYEEKESTGKTFPEFTEMKKGRIIPGTIRESGAVFDYSWPVLMVEPGVSFVLGNWGTFFVKKIDEKQTKFN